MKRPYSQAFRPKGKSHAYLLDRIPMELWRAAKSKCQRESISMRALILGWLKEWVSK